MPKPLLDSLDAIGYETPSPIQSATIPTLLAGRDVVGQAQTGTGKTAAYALPMLASVDPQVNAPQALVLAPTRELALQVCEAVERFAQKMPGVRILPVYGGQAYGMQLSALRKGVHIVVGTPGRIMDHMKRGTLDLSQLRMLVLDEADEMLQMGFVDDVETILASTPDTRQIALFSATMPQQIRRLAKTHLHDPAEITVKTKTQTNTNVSQRFLVVAGRQKLDVLARVLEVEGSDGVIVFVRTRGDTETVSERLRARGFSAAAINGDVPQAQRERTVEQLKNGQIDVLVATDVAARGLDVERITHVINYDIPSDPESYVHRIGRTGRAGRTGAAISFITPRERRLQEQIERTTRQKMDRMSLPSVDEVNESRLSRFDDGITEALERESEISELRDVIDHYVRHNDVPEADVAAALALVAQGDRPLLLDPKRDHLEAVPQRNRDDRQGGYSKGGYNKGGHGRGGYQGGRDNRGGYRGDRNERGDRNDRGDRGGWRNDRNDRGGYKGSRRDGDRFDNRRDDRHDGERRGGWQGDDRRSGHRDDRGDRDNRGGRGGWNRDDRRDNRDGGGQHEHRDSRGEGDSRRDGHSGPKRRWTADDRAARDKGRDGGKGKSYRPAYKSDRRDGHKGGPKGDGNQTW
ncbi:DEAD/DEAH box helicase [Pseudoclavibacter sp. 13-3]|nr:DEAD/DEAH box helicase [Pseudoclavibacter sp. 13-3]MCD7101716.1 DEAD/DEAH box helicase [Pseudoclavibacter sp. 13-3]